MLLECLNNNILGLAVENYYLVVIFFSAIHIFFVEKIITIFLVGKSKDRPKVGRPDRIETVGPTKWAGPVSVQLRSGPLQAFGLGPKGEICPSLNFYLDP